MDIYHGQNQIERLVYQHDRDLYRGNGLPGLTTRMKSVEDCVESLQEYNDKRENKHDMKANLTLGAVLTALAGIIVDLVIHHSK